MEIKVSVMGRRIDSDNVTVRFWCCPVRFSVSFQGFQSSFWRTNFWSRIINFRNKCVVPIFFYEYWEPRQLFHPRYFFQLAPLPFIFNCEKRLKEFVIEMRKCQKHMWHAYLSRVLRNNHATLNFRIPMYSLLPAYVVRREGTVFTGVCLSTGGGGGSGYPPRGGT